MNMDEQIDKLIKDFCYSLEEKGIKFMAAWMIYEGRGSKFNVIHGNCESEELRGAGTTWCWAIEEEIMRQIKK